MLAAYIAGLMLGFSLIVAIGAQNAFVLRQGLMGAHIASICLLCASSDAVLIFAGVVGFARVGAGLPWLVPAMRWVGAAFLAVYGCGRLRAALRTDGGLVPAGGEDAGPGAALATCLALTWLNPHVYLDTVILIGSVSGRFAAHALPFAAGATTASFVFFFGLGYGARLLAPLFATARAWRLLELFMAVTMWTIAWSLLALTRPP